MLKMDATIISTYDAQFIGKGQKSLNRHVSKEDIQVAKKHVKRCLTSFIIKKMQIQITVRYHCTPLGKSNI